tara:strand:+ start:46 stop:240 length:195 start_codon:yes stop_codon:yes gene_type:complete
MSNHDTCLEHIWVSLSSRTIKILDDEGYDEVVKYKFDMEGAEGFHETIATFKENIPEDMITYLA